MNRCFADTFYFLALLNARDEAHEKAVQYSVLSRRPFVTTGFVLIEVADGLAGTGARSVFGTLRSRLELDRRALVIAPSEELFDRGADLYASRPDKGWSLTDCISFVVMQDLGLRDALTADHHFEQAGFVALLRG